MGIHDKRKFHLICWENISKPKNEGGLGFHCLHTLNQAFMMKLTWSMITRLDKLWVKFFRTKYSYYKEQTFLYHCAIRVWRSITKV